MSQNRYAPPSATVADIDSVPESLERPRHVTIGVRLLWLEIAIGVPGLVYDIFNPPLDDPDGSQYWVHLGGVVLTIAILVLSVLITYMTWNGRNWARIVYLVLLILGLLMSMIAYVVSYTVLNEAQFPGMGKTWEGAVYLLQTVLDIVGVGLLFTASSNAWYRAMKAWRGGYLAG